MTALRADKKCGASYIPNTAKCTKGSGVGTAVKAVAVAGAVAGGAAALKSRVKRGPRTVTKIKMQPTVGLQVSRATTAGLRHHKAAVTKGQRRHKAAVKSAFTKGNRRHKAAILKARRKYEPDFMKKRSKRPVDKFRLGSFYKSENPRTKSVRDRVAKIMDSYKKRSY